MREILFRGNQVNDGMWIQGYLFQCWGRAYILWGMTNDTPTMHEVKPETIGQFTGLTDKNGQKIFEGDIVRIEDFVNDVVKWREDIACWTLQGYIIGNTWGSSMLEVIGNIHDNPELLKEQK